MATKKRRATKPQSRSKSRPRSYGEMYKNETTIQQPAATTVKKGSGTATAVAEPQDWRVEYSHVIRDLRTLLLVSAILFAIIIVTGFFM